MARNTTKNPLNEVDKNFSFIVGDLPGFDAFWQQDLPRIRGGKNVGGGIDGEALDPLGNTNLL